MAKVVLGMTMSLDGYISDNKRSIGRLYRDMEELRNSEIMKESIQNTGAVVMGRNAYDMADDPDLYAENYEFQVPIFVLCENEPQKHPKESEGLTFTFVTQGIESAIDQAKEAAGNKEVTVIGGASTGQQCIKAELVDELHIDIMPVLLCEGLKLFEYLGEAPIELEKVSIREIGERTCMQFRVVKQ
ncbi:dihydrofolate reductase family protein [Halobacillus litoralis]|uniref:Riboflavin biosynthesis protein RibD n=1 Tax=Halobacillus litoralis TaxID=45668 RepID=A0A410M9W5_9BACI|nr:dihydrofolate reductase family protein [Halobacillus litoralis]QAS51521.1 riboflavin biosynthesis protein RibD [Halobacillus litoralis]